MEGAGFWHSADTVDRTVGKVGIWECIISGVIFSIIGIILLIWGISQSEPSMWVVGLIIIAIGAIGGFFLLSF